MTSVQLLRAPQNGSLHKFDRQGIFQITSSIHNKNNINLHLTRYSSTADEGITVDKSASELAHVYKYSKAFSKATTTNTLTLIQQ